MVASGRSAARDSRRPYATTMPQPRNAIPRAWRRAGAQLARVQLFRRSFIDVADRARSLARSCREAAHWI
jgi:hypothetical protein